MKKFFLMSTFLFSLGFANAQNIGSAEMRGTMVYVEDLNGKQIFYGTGLTGQVVDYSSEMIVSRQSNMTWCYVISNGRLQSIYGGNFVEGDIKSVNGKSILTKKGNMTCKYNISAANQKATLEYCK
jgi:hypothetical protein